MENMTYDKVNGDVAFIDETHKYFNIKDKSIEYVSVTTLIGKYHEEFDEIFWSSYKTLEKIMGSEFTSSGLKKNLLQTKKFNKKILNDLDINEENFLKIQEEILKSYEKARLEGCERGSKIHKIKEELFYESNFHSVKHLTGNCESFYCKQNDFNLNLEQAIYPEFLIYFHHHKGYLNIAGQVDLLIKDGNDIYIFDYKTNIKGINDKAYFDTVKKSTKKMFHPISDIEDTVLMHYTLQLSLYAYMLQEVNPEFNIKCLKLIHIDADNNEKEIELKYMKDQVKRLVEFHAKKVRTETERKRTTFEFLE